MTQRALSFGSVAAAYEHYRPGYPSELVDQILAYATRPINRALEIGAGTGKATRAFARRGIAVTATDPDAAMLDELARHVPSTVTIVQAAFEDLVPDPSFDLVFAAAAMHWTEPAGRWERVAGLLVPDGIFANFGGPVHLADAAVEAAVRAARAPFLESDGVPPPDGTPEDSEMQWPGTELERSGLFTDVRQAVIERPWTVPAREHIGHLSTISAYLQLTPAVREQAFEAILRALPEVVEVTSDITLHLARRVKP